MCTSLHTCMCGAETARRSYGTDSELTPNWDCHGIGQGACFCKPESQRLHPRVPEHFLES
jgi:hypothetical protein